MKSYEIKPMVQPVFNKLDYSGLMLVPRKIYYEWSRYQLSEMDYFNQQETDLFILPPFESVEKTEEFCRLFFDFFFQYKLKKCIKDPAFWPVNRSYEMFLDWFDVRITINVSSFKWISIEVSAGELTVTDGGSFSRLSSGSQ